MKFLTKKISIPLIVWSAWLVGFWWRSLSSLSPISSETWGYWWVCVPIVVIGAPMGAKFIATRSNLFVVRLLLSLIIIQFATALLILPSNIYLVLFSLETFLAGCTLFLGMIYLGSQRLSRQLTKHFPLKSVSSEDIKITN